jgi:hypothetical protein
MFVPGYALHLVQSAKLIYPRYEVSDHFIAKRTCFFFGVWAHLPGKGLSEAMKTRRSQMNVLG